jgi:hypothetical protein
MTRQHLRAEAEPVMVQRVGAHASGCRGLNADTVSSRGVPIMGPLVKSLAIAQSDE